MGLIHKFVTRLKGTSGGLVESSLGRLKVFSDINQDTPTHDAFGRMRVSNPETLFDNKNIFDDPDLASSVENQPLFYDNQETSGSGTSTNYNANEVSQELTVGATTAGTRVRQTRQRFNYQPGKSMLIIMSFYFASTTSGITQREGLFDENNGIILEDNGTNIGIVRRTKTSGSVVNNRVAQSSWNIDPLDGTGDSGVTIDFTKTSLFVIDIEWLGVGRVRCGVVIDGAIIYCHQFLNTNVLSVPYMATPNLPLRSEIDNDGTAAATTMTQICSTIISEGGQNPLGVLRYKSTAGTHLDMATENIIYAVIGIRLKSAYIGAIIDLEKMEMQLQTANHKVEWILKFNPTVANTFTYSDESRSAVQTAIGVANNTVTGGFDIDGGFVESGGAALGKVGSTDVNLKNALKLGSLIDGTADEIVLCARPIGGSSGVDVEACLAWRELT